MELLFLAHRAPFAPDRGDRIRGYHLLRHLARRATVHVIAFVDTPAETVVPPDMRAMLGEVRVFPRTKSRARALAEALASGRPLSVAAFADGAVSMAVADLLARRPVDVVYAFSGQMGQYLPRSGPRTIMDFVDLDSAKFEAYAQDAVAPMRWLMRREARLLAAFERQVAASADASLFVSEAEAALLPGALAVENGIDTTTFDPAAAVGRADLGDAGIVFTGQMDYRPNVDAVTAFARQAMPRIVARCPNARFAIVGRAPTVAVRALAGEHVIVTGEVADVRPWLAAARVVVAPLELARGIQNKVLEAMAMARPVVASPAAAEGIDHAGTIRVAEDMAADVLALLADPATAAALGRAARARVIERYGWEARLAPLDALLGLPAMQEAA